MGKQRLFYLDFIRALAVITILITHYNALFLYFVPQDKHKMVLTASIANIYIGDFGVSLFLILSGAALTYTYGDKINIKIFYKKRFIGLFPIFWIAYGGAFFLYWLLGNIDTSIPKSRIILSFWEWTVMLNRWVSKHFILSVSGF